MAKQAAKTTAAEIRPIADNRRAHARYTFDETYEVGMVLLGSEVRSARDRKVEIADAWATTQNGELVLMNLYIAPWAFARAFGHEPKRARKLLAHRHEIDKMEGRVKQKGYTLVPLKMYFRGSKVKLELGLGRNKDVADRREEIKAREGEREARAAMNAHTRGGKAR